MVTSSASIVSPNPADAELAVRLLGESGIEARAFGSVAQLARSLSERSGCLILVEEALVSDELATLREALGELPAWCDLPLVVISSDVAAAGAAIASAFPQSGNVTLLERPLNPHTLASSVHVASRAIARQREVGELLAQRDQAVKLRDEFLAMLAHELRNPLAPMRNALYIVRRLNIDDERLARNTAILERQVNHMVRMVDDLMDVARLERGKVALQMTRVDLNRVVASALESCLDGVQQRGHRVKLMLSARPLPIDGDAVRLEQVVCNLVNNAAKFTLEPSEIVVQTREEAGFAVVEIRDKGIGFTPEAAAGLFDPFMQLNPTLARTAGGLGMGLTIVRRLVDLHGGSVQARSEGPGRGATFSVRLALAQLEPERESGPQAQPGGTRSRRIVVIEDNPDIRDSLHYLLSMWGHEVALAGDGSSGLELVLRTRPEVALVDIGLPLMNGYDVARQIRSKLSDAGIRLIAVTGYGQPADREQALQAGFDEHLLKPIEPDVLERLLA